MGAVCRSDSLTAACGARLINGPPPLIPKAENKHGSTGDIHAFVSIQHRQMGWFYVFTNNAQAISGALPPRIG
jgi:hypothetical protein